MENKPTYEELAERVRALERENSGLRDAESKLQYHLKAEKVVMAVSAELAGIDGEGAEPAMERALSLMGTFVRADRIYICQVGEDGKRLDCTHEWCAQGVESGNRSGDDTLPLIAGHIRRQGIFHAADVAVLTTGTGGENEPFTALGVQSIIAVPMATSKRRIGFLGVDAVREHRSWDRNDIALIRFFSQMLSCVIEHGQTDQRLREREALLKAFMTALPDVSFILDEDGRYVGVYGSQEQLLYLQPDKLIGSLLRDVLPPDTAGEFLGIIRHTIESGKPQIFEYKLEVLAGETWFEGRTSPMGEQVNGKSTVVWLAHDITEKRKTQQELADSERRLADIIEFLPDPTWVIDIRGRVIAWNKAIEELTGVAKKDILGQGAYAHSVPFYGQRRPALIDLVIHRDKIWEDRYLKLEEKDGVLISSLSHHPDLGVNGTYFAGTAGRLYDAEGRIVGAIQTVRDITDEKRSEIERERLIAKLKKAVDDIETLSGLVPICASCKKIRDDKGYWNRIESYIQKHSKARFSHGLCPDCSEQLYGDEEWYQSSHHNKNSK